MKYNNAIEDMSEDDFEDMVNVICQKVLGTGVVSFSKGRDGGKDGRFHGRANKYPSETKPWEGKMIIQAKHTSNPLGDCMSGEFYTNKESVVNLEIIKLQKIKSGEGLDCYLLFTNRKYSGTADDRIRKKISAEVPIAIDRIGIIGIDTLNRYLRSYNDIVRQFGLNKYNIPFDFSDEEIKELILNFKKQLPAISEDLKNRVDEVMYDFDRIEIEEKNRKNRLGEEYYKDVILAKSLMDFEKLRAFLGDPKNAELKELYFDVVSELNELITIKRDDFSAFEEIFYFIYDKVCSENVNLLSKKRFVRTLLHYMYFECEIGKK